MSTLSNIYNSLKTTSYCFPSIVIIFFVCEEAWNISALPYDEECGINAHAKRIQREIIRTIMVPFSSFLSKSS